MGKPAHGPESPEALRDEAFCPHYHHAVELIGRRWTGAILLAMISGLSRYAEIRDAVPHLSDTMLGQRLRELEDEGIVSREISPRPPIRVDYRLTEKGLALQGAIEAISAWADTWVAVPDEIEQVEQVVDN
ncbi:MAG: helix-turn-helix transcriptional regulator [Actinobacteria bacterium]|nr:helix-turn-helix transcriptional regulator [Actinomycetota bacterium]